MLLATDNDNDNAASTNCIDNGGSEENRYGMDGGAWTVCTLEMVRLVKNGHTCMDNATTDNIWPLKPTARRIMALTRVIAFLPTETVAFKDMNMIPVDIIILVNISMAVFALKRIITRANAAQAT
jgi:hypothetical protein